MRLGLIARADHRGLAIQTASMHRALHPVKTMIVDCPSAQPLPLHLEQFPGDGVTVIRGLPTREDFREFCEGLTVAYTAETSYGASFWDEAERAGVRTVLAANYEFLDRHDRPTLWAMPSMWHYDDVPFDNKTFLPVPVEADRFVNLSPRCDRNATHFLHVIGRPAIHDRNGTEILLRSLEHIRSEVTVTIKCQQGGYVSSLAPDLRTNKNVTLVIDPGDVENYWDNYAEGDVLVMPRRFGGLCLPVNEALGAGMPVIMPDISPNNAWLPQEWLVEANFNGSFMAKQRIDYYAADHLALARKIDQFSTDPALYLSAREKAAKLADELSWASMKPVYEKVLGNV